MAGQRVPRERNQDIGGEFTPRGIVDRTPVGGDGEEKGEVVSGGKLFGGRNNRHQTRQNLQLGRQSNC